MAKGKVTNLTISLKPGSEKTALLSWTFKDAPQATGFEYAWEYLRGSKWIPSSHGTAEKEAARVGNASSKTFRIEYSAPEDALKVRCKIRPVSGTYTVTENKKEVEKKYFTANWTGVVTLAFSIKMDAPSITVDMDGTYAKVTVTSSESDCGTCDVEVYDGSKRLASLCVNKRKCEGEAVLHFKDKNKVPPGKTYKFRARIHPKTGGSTANRKADSNWSEKVNGKSIPATPKANKASALSSTSARFTWSSADGAATYEVEYVADSSSYFNTNPSMVSSVDDIHGTTFDAVNVESGHKYYFRVRAVNETGEGAWSSVLNTVLATRPDAPTVYDTDPSYIYGQTVRLRWTHNSEDESDQTAAKVYVSIGSGQPMMFSVSNDADHYDLNTGSSSFSALAQASGTTLTWNVETKGVHSSYSPRSESRSFKVYLQPTASVSFESNGEPIVGDMTSWPLEIVMEAGNGGSLEADAPAAYTLTIAPLQEVEVIDIYGDTQLTPAGETVFSQTYYPVNRSQANMVTAVLGPGDVDLVSGVDYRFIVDAAMESGLRASTSANQRVYIDVTEIPDPSAGVWFDPELLTAYIEPACYAEDENGDPTDELQENIELAVYRMEANGSLTLLLDGIQNDEATTIADPHANFGTCTYRVVARDTETGAVSYDDMYANSSHSTCVIQWDEEWVINNNGDDEDNLYYGLSGTRIDGLYNMQLSESGEVEREHAEFIGRKHPVAYYGTQLGHTARYSLDFPRDDTATLALCRQLLAYRGDVYIREPRGMGFWASVRCGLSMDSKTETVSLSVDATEVDHENESTAIDIEQEAHEWCRIVEVETVSVLDDSTGDSTDYAKVYFNISHIPEVGSDGELVRAKAKTFGSGSPTSIAASEDNMTYICAMFPYRTVWHGSLPVALRVGRSLEVTYAYFIANQARW